ncbi:oligopeptide-binding protein oppA [Fictibacillus macauensis ZFHKF-1]|uniref:Oligopeptide-binding protein oppA n=1 Tax=Fictibacillus macauensis ZFHKF-1 TaxID=1196324 RepID=I8UCS6_9BACL|nr:peptide ABC transporter substrate-binding protein [Fictibacillus macauensis]EIT84588.1 oligopeptide-binding protein oppA [Fictibacillus macauensis ZFHKF-1]
MNKSKMGTLLTVGLAGSVVLSACSSGSNGSTTSDGNKKVINLIENQDIPKYDTAKADDQVSFEVSNNTHEGLYTLDSKDTPILAGAASEPEVKDGGKTWVIKLRDDAKWSNGEPVTANDYVFGWRRAMDKDTKSQYNFMFTVANILNADKILDPKDKMYNKLDQLGIKAINDKTLEIKFSKPAKSLPYLKSLLAFPTLFPQNEKFVKEKGEKFGLEPENQLYNGPYKMTKWKHGAGWTLEKNDKYWDKKNVKIDQINTIVNGASATKINLFETGKLDRTAVPAEYIDKYKTQTDKFKTIPESTVFFLRFNQTKNKALANKNIRRAIDMGWDKKQLSEKVLKDGSVPAYFLVPTKLAKGPDGKDFRDDVGNLNVGDNKKAQDFWKKGLKEIGKDKVTIELLNTDSDGAKRDSQFLKDQLEQNLPGLTVNIKQTTFKQKLEIETKMDYDMSYSGWGPDYPDPMTFLDMFVTGNPHNEMGYSNKKYDEMIKKAVAETDVKKRWKIMQDAEKLLITDDVAVGGIYQRSTGWVTNPKLTGVTKHNFGGDYSYKYWDLEK